LVPIKDASRFQLTQNGVLQSITTYFTSVGFNAKAAIYTDNNGAPSNLITKAAPKQSPQAAGKHSPFPQSSPPQDTIGYA